MTQDELIVAGEYLAIPKWLATVPNKTLSASAKLVYAAIVNCLGKNMEAWPHQTTIADYTGLSRDVVVDAVERLAKFGLKTKRTRKGNVYAFEKSAFAMSGYAIRQMTTLESVDLPHCEVANEDIGMSSSAAQELHHGTTQRTTPENNTIVRASPPASGSPFVEVINPGAGALTRSDPALDYPQFSEHSPEPARNVPPSPSPKSSKSLKPRKGKGGKAAPVTESVEDRIAGADAIEWAIQSLENLGAYLQFGAGAMKGETAPGPGDWTTGTGDDAAAWTDRQFLCYAIFTVNMARDAIDLPLLAPNWGDVGRRVKKLVESVGRRGARDFLRCVAKNWQLVVALAKHKYPPSYDTISCDWLVSPAAAVAEMSDSQREVAAANIKIGRDVLAPVEN